MQKSQNIKVNNVGRASCLGLLALGLVLVNPMVGSAYADEEVVADMVADDTVNPDDGIMTLADTPSTVNISFAPSSGSTSMSPTTSAGEAARVNVLATVGVKNSGGYSVYLKSSNQNLVGQKNSANVIPGISGSVAYENLATNTWGYYAGEGTAVPTGAKYKAVSSGQGDKITENTNKKITSDTKQIMLSFAAKIGSDKPADNYQNTVTMSVVSSPLQTTLTDISDMQDMKTAICEASDMYETKQLKDTRDGKYYWVTKLADGKCWMTQNLDLDLSTSKTLTPSDSDVTTNWTPGFNTEPQATSDTVNPDSQTETRSWSLGDYRMKDSIAASGSDCGYSKNDASQCTSQFEAYTTPTSQDKDEKAHYILGNHYQWNAATAGTGDLMTSGQASGSICPKSWRLPTSTNSGEFKALMDAYSIGSDVAKLTSSSLYFVRGGYVNQTTSGLFRYAGDIGIYWSSTPDNSDRSFAYTLYFNGTGTVNPSSTDTRRGGYSVRCLAQ